MWADAHAARRCLRYAQTCFAAALELPTLFSKSKSNAQSRLRSRSPKATATRCCGLSARVCVVCVLFQIKPEMIGILQFPNLSKSELQTPTHSHTLCAFCRICTFANSTIFTKIPAEDEKPICAHIPDIFPNATQDFSICH